MNEQQKQNLASLYGHIEKYLSPTGKTSNDDFDFIEETDAYLLTNLKEILDFELAKNESLEATVATLTSELKTSEELEFQQKNISINDDVALMAFNDCPDDFNSLCCKRSWMDGYLSGASAAERAIKQSLRSLRFN